MSNDTTTDLEGGTDCEHSRPIDRAIKEAGPEAILARLSNELGTSIQLGDGTVYEGGDQHTPADMDETGQEERS